MGLFSTNLCFQTALCASSAPRSTLWPTQRLSKVASMDTWSFSVGNQFSIRNKTQTLTIFSQTGTYLPITQIRYRLNITLIKSEVTMAETSKHAHRCKLTFKNFSPFKARPCFIPRALPKWQASGPGLDWNLRRWFSFWRCWPKKSGKNHFRQCRIHLSRIWIRHCWKLSAELFDIRFNFFVLSNASNQQCLGNN